MRMPSGIKGLKVKVLITWRAQRFNSEEDAIDCPAEKVVNSLISYQTNVHNFTL